MVLVGVDIGGTKIAFAKIVRGVAKNKQVFPTPSSYSQLLALLQEQLALFKPSKVGLSVPGFTDKKGTIIFAGSLLSFLVGKSLIKDVSSFLSCPVKQCNDADAFALAEHDKGRTLGIIWGSGIGSGFVVDDKLFSSQVELGHMPLRDGTLESSCGGRFVEYNYALWFKKEHSLPEIYQETKVNKHVALFFDQVLEDLASGIATAILLLNPDTVVLGGGASNLPVLRELKSKLRKKLPQEFSLPTIRRHSRGADAGLFGCVKLFSV